MASLSLTGHLERKHKNNCAKTKQLKESESTLGLPSMRGICALLAQDSGL